MIFFVPNRGRKLSSHGQRGATLMELMISVFVFAIGVLGYAALQTRSLQATYDNTQRADVVTIVDGLMARISANNNSAAKVQYAAQLNGAFVCPGAAPANCAETTGGVVPGAACNAATMATYDVWDELCNNPNGGLNGVQSLQITLTCVGNGACPDGVDLNLASNWCARSAEQDDDLDNTAGGNACATDISEQSYTLVFRP